MKVHEALGRAIKENGVKTLFGLMGDGNLYLVHSYVHACGGVFVSATHEANATLMAFGYASTSGKLGVVTVTHGPGLSNAITALVEGVRSRTPMVLIAGDVPDSERSNVQYINQRELVLSTGAGFEPLSSATSAVDDLNRALRRASAERRPIVANMPTDLAWLDIAEGASAVKPGRYFSAVPPDPEGLDAALGVILSSRRPLILAGHGANDSDSQATLLRLADTLGAPLATTLRAKDLFYDHPFNLGIFGTLSSDVATETILNSDCLIVFGASLSDYTTAHGSLVKDKAIVQCDIDRTQLGLNVDPTVGLVADACAASHAMLAILQDVGQAPSSFQSIELKQRILDDAVESVDGKLATAGTVDVRQALIAIDAAAPPDRILVTDVGRSTFAALKRVRVRQPRSLVWTANFGSVGLGMSTAVGAHFGAPERPVVYVCGDGGFMMGGIAEFSTAVRHHIDLTVVVCNDGGYGAEHVQFVNRGLDASLSLFEWPDLAAVANSLGGTGITVNKPGDLVALPQAFGRRDRPLLIDLKLDPHQVPSVGH